MSPDTSQPQPGLTLREQVALALARCADDPMAQADAALQVVSEWVEQRRTFWEHPQDEIVAALRQEADRG